METEYAWAAGFFDGEGCSTLSSGYISISIAQNHIEVLERFKKIVGLGAVSGPYLTTNENRNPFWRYNVFGNDAKDVMEQIFPYLGSVKKEQWEKTLQNAKPIARRGYCRKDLHQMTVENTYFHSKTNKKTCRECHRIREAGYRNNRQANMSMWENRV